MPQLSLERQPPRPGPSTLEGTLERVVFANEENAWSVVRLTVAGQMAPVTAVGNLLRVRPGENLRLSGEWITDPKYGRQFKVEAYQTITPKTLDGIERYLGSGLIRGIGKVMASRLVARFGMETLEVIEHQPERLAEVGGIGPKRRGDIQKAWIEQRETKEVMVFLQSHGIATGHAIKIYKRYGSEAMAVLRQDPYRLATDIHGIGFQSADRIAAALGTARTAPERLAAGVRHLLGEAADRGHVFLPRPKLVEEGQRLLEVEPGLLGNAVDALAAAGEVVVDTLADAPEEAREAVYLKALHAAETGVAKSLRALLARPDLPFDIDPERAVAWFEKRETLSLAPAQREAIRRGLTSKVLVITGGPGTGKTTLVRGILAILEKKGRTVFLAAPTGRAAKRLAEATGGTAATLHRLLEFDPRSRAFERDRDRPLGCDLLIVDEASMLDTVLAYHLLKAVPNGGRLIFVGDVDQLPSVGPGRFLGDLIRSGTIDVVRLKEIFRQAGESAIVVNAHRINRGVLPLFPGEGELKVAARDFFFIERQRPEDVLETVTELVAQRIPAGFGLDPVEEIQVLSPMNRGTLGTQSLNAVLRERLNPPPLTGGASGPHGFRVGDKVMQVRNNYDLEVWNGDVGRVVGIDEDEGTVAVEIDGRAVSYDSGALDELVLAYACTIHKSQGSEYPCVVVPLHGQHQIMLQRNLLYTALTRARRLAIFVGERSALAAAVRNHRTSGRFTLLSERLGAI
ncbi:MAG: exodeoxyribonuclease alpha subunit [Acidobacteriota bacterium]|jgi:exodeoxyribonuclease V alpha subunit|nr:exodeoxyribonuclease alpha subunit [Acidobacteriota bacterium]